MRIEKECRKEYNISMETPKTFLIWSLVIFIVVYFFGGFDDLNKMTNAALILSWFSLYKIIENQEVHNKSMDQIERRLKQLEK